jgi:hypothetical protein
MRSNALRQSVSTARCGACSSDALYQSLNFLPGKFPGTMTIFNGR